MGLGNIFQIAASSMGAESVRLSTVASNLANANATSATPEGVYRARMPVFQTVLDDQGGAGVRVSNIVESTAPPEKRYAPNDPQADGQGYIYAASVNPVDAMVNMIAAARSYQNSVQAMSTAKQLMLDTLSLGK
ncbi:MAG: flagellar basal body rod protein FlgC [Nevskiaceae bacterium]|nr:MAG: flagellar basal body rod protein FlgC [Nevskiaceae bacterium]TBR71555.1 MAG: flagellar basal body rod protein FlgC [Nevskiaceae bacterium]